jgi:threonine dehydratase
MVSLSDIQTAAARIRGVARHTPLLPLEGDVYLKPENLQVTGSFKFRGAYNAISSLAKSSVAVRGVVADSSGNHAQGVAAAAKMHNIPATIVIPENAPDIKVQRTAAWGATIVRCPNASSERMRVAMHIRDQQGLEYIAPFDDARMIAGQGTIGLEIAADMPDVQTVLVCVGGGGLLAGIAKAIKSLLPHCRVIGVEPELAADARDSFYARERRAWDASLVTRTICDGVRTQGLGELNWDIIKDHVDDMIAVSEDAVLEAMRHLYLETKLAVEPTGALTTAAVRSGVFVPTGKTVCIVSGGNFDPQIAAKVLLT